MFKYLFKLSIEGLGRWRKGGGRAGRQGVYRGGMRPLDLYYRIHAGINGAPMPAAKGTVPPEDIWHIVNYIKSLPYDFNGTLGVDRPMVARDRM